MIAPQDWKVKRLGSVAELQRGFDLPNTKRVEGHVPVVSSAGITGYHNEFKAKAPGVVTGRYGSIGDVFYIHEDYWPLNTALWVKDFHGNDPEFVYYLLSRFDFRKFSDGTGVPGVNRNNLHAVKVGVPPLSEQKQIAEILSNWDKAITTAEQLLINNQQRKKALMQQLLTGKNRFPEFSGEWKRVQLRDCAVCLDNRRVPLNSEQRSVMSGSIPYWGANGIVDYVNDYIFDETIVLLAEDGGYFDEYATRPIANISYGKCWVNNHAHILSAKENCLNEWLYYSLVHANILGFVNGVTRAKLNKSDMLQIPLYLPRVDEQRKIVSVLSAADREIGALHQKRSCLKQEKKSLMQQLLTGKRRVTIDHREVA